MEQKLETIFTVEVFEHDGATRQEYYTGELTNVKQLCCAKQKTGGWAPCGFIIVPIQAIRATADMLQRAQSTSATSLNSPASATAASSAPSPALHRPQQLTIQADLAVTHSGKVVTKKRQVSVKKSNSNEQLVASMYAPK